MLEITGLRKIYPGGKVAIDGIDLSLGKGVFGLLGPNGAGKSSLVEILAANQEFESGSVLLDGVNVAKSPAAWRRRIGYMPQAFDFPPNATGREMLVESAILLGLKPGREKDRISMLLERVNLSWAADRYAAQYSRGMKQRLGIALALLHSPLLLLFDEPTAGLDPVERALFRDLLLELASEHIVILSTHIVPDVERCCTRIGVLSAGRLVYLGTPGDLTAESKGMVWEVRMEADAIEAEIGKRRAVSVSRHRGISTARLVADRPPAPGAVNVSPNLEDAYFQLLGGRV